MGGGAEGLSPLSAPAIDQIPIDAPSSLSPWIEVTVKRIKAKDGRERYECETLDGHSLSLEANWVQQDIQFEDCDCQGYIYEGRSGTVYYTWSLNPDNTTRHSERRER